MILKHKKLSSLDHVACLVPRKKKENTVTCGVNSVELGLDNEYSVKDVILNELWPYFG